MTIADESEVLVVAGDGCDAFRIGQPLSRWVVPRRRDRRFRRASGGRPRSGLPFSSAVVALLAVRGSRAGSVIALYLADQRRRPEDTRGVSETAALVAAQPEVVEMEAQNERLALAQLWALRALISPHFIDDALAAAAALIRSSPEEARELLPASYGMRFAVNGRTSRWLTSFVTSKRYLRLAQARFRDRLKVRVRVAPEVLVAVVPALSVQPLVANAVRHGVETTRGPCRLEILGAELDNDVELCVRDDGPGMTPEAARRALEVRSKGIGLFNVYTRLQNTFGPSYGLQVESRVDGGTAVRATVPKVRAGVRAL